MAKFSPRSYQREALKTIKKAEKEALVKRVGQEEKRALIIMASGLGKTVLSAFYAKEWLERHGGRVLYLCDQNYILEQAEVTFRSIIGGGSSYGFFHGQEKTAHRVTFLFSSFQTMRESRNGFKQKEFSLVIVDESHHSYAKTYLPTLEYFLPKFTLAMTATPERTDLKDIREIYGKEIFSFPIEKALAKGLLAKVNYQVVTDELQNLDYLKTSVGKLSIRALNKKIFVKKRDREIADIIKKKMSHISNARTIIFCPSVYYCEHLSRYLPNSLPIHNEVSTKEQDLRLRAFRNGTANTILTVDKINEGVDVPETNVVIFLRSTVSSTIFFQQLGRGLRKVPGKECVHVLDFVVNCERIEMLDGFWNRVKKDIKDIERDKGIKRPISIDVGNIRFTSVARDVLSVIARIRQGYTKDILIQQLKDLAKKLGKTPTIRDLDEASKNGKCASRDPFVNTFGSFNNALKAAELDINLSYTEDKLVKQLKSLSKKLKRIPSQRDVNEYSKRRECASASTLVKIFGSFNNALKVAGLYKYSEDSLKKQLKKLFKKLKRVPTSKDLSKASKSGECASSPVFRRVFGSFNNAIKAAGMKINVERSYEKEILIKQLCDLKRELRRTPTRKDITKASKSGKCASFGVFKRAFRNSHDDSFNNALEEAGMKPNKKRWSKISK